MFEFDSEKTNKVVFNSAIDADLAQDIYVRGLATFIERLTEGVLEANGMKDDAKAKRDNVERLLSLITITVRRGEVPIVLHSNGRTYVAVKYDGNGSVYRPNGLEFSPKVAHFRAGKVRLDISGDPNVALEVFQAATLAFVKQYAKESGEKAKDDKYLSLSEATLLDIIVYKVQHILMGGTKEGGK